MPTYRNPETGDEVEDPSGGLWAFYEAHGYVRIFAEDPDKPAPKGKKFEAMPSDLGKLADDISKGEGD